MALGFLVGLGWFLAQVLGGLLVSISSVLILVVVSFFLAAGLDPSVRWLTGRGLRRPWAVLAVILGFLAALVLFVVALVPVITDQVNAIVSNAPDWLQQLQRNKQIQSLDDHFHFIEKAQAFISNGTFARGVFGGVLGVTVAVLGFLGNAFIVIVLTLYFLASLERTKSAIYELAPASRRDRVRDLGDRMLESIGGYVSGAVVVASCAGISSLVFLAVVGLKDYAVALAAVVTLLDIIPMIGATIGAAIVSAIALATDVRTGIVCVIFYVVYQQVENYLIYPRVMSRSVNVPGAVTVIAALTGAALLGVVGALLAIPTAAALLLLLREVWVPRQEAR
ncbi:AI-2E family transporter [Nocardioides marmoribigeumensis]|uniref:PurR-regulated permease PerM n=1 Tax=Nocardioides marmoribigeumensis TaxID=433649 RepID=A0ABU2BZ03_9ACTN|nr:AI-2E family transporter [Nocardioides marmoribigeumensis]MDR7363634.1 putative PurR-regulated permease PerM [Nocardioides marmoribigeumensis]